MHPHNACQMSCSKKDEYKYTKLKDVKEAAMVNLYGILAVVLKTNVPTTNGRFHTVIFLQDDSLSLDEAFRMHFFIPEEYPVVYLQVGNIFRFHRVKVEGRNDAEKVDGRIFNSTDVVMFPRVKTPENKIHTSAKTIQFTEPDNLRIAELRLIAQFHKLCNGTVVISQVIADREKLTCRLGSEETIGNDKNGDNDVDENEIDSSRILSVIASNSRKVLSPLATQKRHLVINPFSHQKQQEPILLEDDDQRLEDFESSLLTEGLGDIPAVDDHGNTIYRSTECMPFGDGQKTTRITAESTVNFQWPRNRVKVKIVDIKPRLQALQSYGEKNLLSGICSKCGSYTMYSRIVWHVNKESKLKKAMCLPCHENGVCSYVCLRFRLRLTVRDASGSLFIYAVKENARVFLGCSEREYRSNEKCRKRVVGLLSEALSSKAFLHLEVYKANTYTRIMHYVCNTSLSVMLNDPTKT